MQAEREIKSDEKVVLRTGKEHESVGSTVGLFLCLIGITGLLFHDPKPQPIEWFWLFLLFVNVVSGATKHIAAFRKRKHHKQAAYLNL